MNYVQKRIIWFQAWVVFVGAIGFALGYYLNFLSKSVNTPELVDPLLPALPGICSFYAIALLSLITKNAGLSPVNTALCVVSMMISLIYIGSEIVGFSGTVLLVLSYVFTQSVAVKDISRRHKIPEVWISNAIFGQFAASYIAFVILRDMFDRSR